MAVCGIDDQKVDTSIDEALGALDGIGTNADGGGGAKTALRILGGIGIKLRFLDILDGDEADAIAFSIHHQQFFNAMLVQQAARFLLIDAAFLDRDQIFAGHQFIDFLLRIGSEAHVAIRQNADEAAVLVAAGAAIFNHRNTGNAMRLHQRLRFCKRRIRAYRDRVDDHAAFELLHLPNFFSLFDGGEVAVDNADAAGLGHGDSETAFGHRVHGGREDWKIEIDIAGDAGGDIRLSRHNLGMSGLQQHIVKCESVQTSGCLNDACHDQIPS
ncbi:hypothetical protein D3C86_1314440 [compost metagenome]